MSDTEYSEKDRHADGRGDCMIVPPERAPNPPAESPGCVACSPNAFGWIILAACPIHGIDAQPEYWGRPSAPRTPREALAELVAAMRTNNVNRRDDAMLAADAALAAGPPAATPAQREATLEQAAGLLEQAASGAAPWPAYQGLYEQAAAKLRAVLAAAPPREPGSDFDFWQVLHRWRHAVNASNEAEESGTQNVFAEEMEAASGAVLDLFGRAAPPAGGQPSEAYEQAALAIEAEAKRESVGTLYRANLFHAASIVRSAALRAVPSANPNA